MRRRMIFSARKLTTNLFDIRSHKYERALELFSVTVSNVSVIP